VDILLVKLCNLSGYHHSLKSPYIINSQKVWSGFKKMGPIFHKLRIWTRTLLVSEKFFYINN